MTTKKRNSKRRGKGSKGEQAIAAWLEELGVNYKREKSCTGTGLRLDFYLPDYDTAIEFQGIQHYEWINVFHKTYWDFLAAQRRDNEKKEWCMRNDICLLEIRYDDINNISNILDMFFENDF